MSFVPWKSPTEATITYPTKNILFETGCFLTLTLFKLMFDPENRKYVNDQ